MKKTVNILLVLFLLLFALLAFGPCLRKSVLYTPDGETSISYETYTPAFCCIVTALEIVFIYLGPSKFLNGMGMLFHLIKSAVPFWYRSNDNGGFIVYQSSCSPAVLGYLLMAVSITILILYIRGFRGKDGKTVI